MSTVETDGVPITVVRNGPYLVHGSVTLSDDTNVEMPAPTGASVALCRCGRSGTKEFCDGTYTTVGIDDTKRPTDRATS